MTEPLNDDTDPRNVPQRIRDALEATIAQAIGEHEHGFALKWHAVIESVEPDGERSLWILRSENSTDFDALGHIEYARQRTRLEIDYKIAAIVDARNRDAE